MELQRIGLYTLHGEIGRGSEGVVYAATMGGSTAYLAVKVWHAEICHAPLIERVQRMAARIQTLDHPNLVRIHKVHVVDGRLVMAMEYLRQSLESQLSQHGPLTISRALLMARDAALGLAALHTAGIVHRDVKPGNIFCDKGSPTRLGDTGHADELDRPASAGRGSLAYASPEQRWGAVVDARTDIYSLGVVLYEMLTGKRPFAGYEGMVRNQVIPMTQWQADVPEPVIRIVERAMHEVPAERFASAAELAEALHAATEHCVSNIEVEAGVPFRSGEQTLWRLPQARQAPDAPRVRSYPHGLSYSEHWNSKGGGFLDLMIRMHDYSVFRVVGASGEVHIAAANEHDAMVMYATEFSRPQGALIFYPDSEDEVIIPYLDSLVFQLGSDPFTLSDMMDETYLVIDDCKVPGLIGNISEGHTRELIWRGSTYTDRTRELRPGETFHFADVVPMRFERRSK